MKTTLVVDRAGRVVIPKPVRQRYGWTSGRTVRLLERADGIVLTSAEPGPRLVRKGGLLVADTGAGPADPAWFDPAAVRDESLSRRDTHEDGH